jgi:pyruvate dehydrogenase E1 component alpha subunit
MMTCSSAIIATTPTPWQEAADPGEVMAEICGKATGCSKGKGGSMHICDAERGFYGGYGIVGGNVPIALGLGWSIKYRNGDQVAVCFFGDGSMNQGGFHETLNMAQLFKVPVLFVLENNGYAMGTSVERSHANTDLTDRVGSYAMKRERIDGQDVVQLHERVQQIVAEMRDTKEPFFLECMTQRYHGHGAADEAKQTVYRTRDEIERARSVTPSTSWSAFWSSTRRSATTSASAFTARPARPPSPR